MNLVEVPIETSRIECVWEEDCAPPFTSNNFVAGTTTSKPPKQRGGGLPDIAGAGPSQGASFFMVIMLNIGDLI